MKSFEQFMMDAETAVEAPTSRFRRVTKAEVQAEKDKAVELGLEKPEAPKFDSVKHKEEDSKKDHWKTMVGDEPMNSGLTTHVRYGSDTGEDQKYALKERIHGLNFYHTSHFMKRIHGIPEEGESGKRYTGRGEGVTGELLRKMKRGIAKSFETDGAPTSRKENVLYLSKSTGYSAYADITPDKEVHLKSFMPPNFGHDNFKNRKLMIEQNLGELVYVVMIE